MKKTFKLLLICLLISINCSVLAQFEEEPCKLILQNGLYKTFNMAKSENFQQDLKIYFSSEQFKKDFRDSKWGGNISLIINSIPVNLGISSSDNEISEFQSKVKNSTSLTINQSFYDYAYSNIPDVELAKAYTDCIGFSRKFGFKVNTSVSDKEVLFIVSYYKEINSDPMPKVVRFEIRGASNILKSFNTGDELKNQTSITCDRDPDKDLTLVLETDRGVASYKVPSEPAGFNKDLPVGTIIVSYLNWTEFQFVTKNNTNNPAGNLWSAKYSKWAPADGREVRWSVFESIAKQIKVPDLRGVFLRGLNQFDYDQGTILENEKKDPESRTRGSFQKDEVGPHIHSISDNSAEFAFRTGGMGIQSNKGQEIQWTKPNISVNPSTGLESRPKNVAIYYYIRIN